MSPRLYKHTNRHAGWQLIVVMQHFNVWLLFFFLNTISIHASTTHIQLRTNYVFCVVLRLLSVPAFSFNYIHGFIFIPCYLISMLVHSQETYNHAKIQAS